MSNQYLDNVMKSLVPFQKSPVTFYYNQLSDGGSSFAMYDSASQRELYSCSYSAQGAANAAAATPATAVAAGFNPFDWVKQLLSSPDASAAAAPHDGMIVCPLPMPIAPACWLPTSGAIGIAIVCKLTSPPTVLCYRLCEIDPATHSIAMKQMIGPFYCAFTGKLDYAGGAMTAVEGQLTVKVVPSASIPLSVTLFDHTLSIPV